MRQGQLAEAAHPFVRSGRRSGRHAVVGPFEGRRPDRGVHQREVDAEPERGGQQVPEILDAFLARLERGLDDPGYVELTRRGLEAAAWEPDDPRIEELASELADRLLADGLPTGRALSALPAGSRGRSDAAARYEVVNRHREDGAPSIARLNVLVEAKLRAAGVDVPHG
ncbi:hypothetical protein [Streptomyces lavendulae]|uniref:hypothetical protein n=1 Tax=Streptomyces lavendulae TaxID=1914 RepID=UPI00381CD14E